MGATQSLAGAKVFLFVGFIISFTAVIAATWVMAADNIESKMR
jgi:hypothetical protein